MSLKEYSNLIKQINIIDNTLLDLILERNKCIKRMSNLNRPIEEVKFKNYNNNMISFARDKAISFNVSPVLIHKIFNGIVNDMFENEILIFTNAKKF